MAKDLKPTLDALRELIEKAKAGRLAPAEEQAGAAAFRDVVLAGGKVLSAGIELLGDLPWFISVNGTVEAWGQLTPARKRSFLTALRNVKTEVGLRMRLSISRGLFKADPESALKLIVSTLTEMHKTNVLEGRDRSAVGNVLIGKTKPWILQVDLSHLKAAEAKLVGLCALEAAVAASPPAAFAVVEWAKNYARINDLSSEAKEAFGKTVARWGGRWQKQIPKLELPAEVLQHVPARAQIQTVDRSETPVASVPAGPALEIVPSETETATDPEETSPPVRSGVPERARSSEHRNARERSGRPSRPPQDHRPEKAQPRPARDTGSTVSDLLQQIEHQFEQVRVELQAARQQLRTSKPAGNGAGPVSGETAKLRQENARLTDEVQLLREALHDLSNTDFEVAVSRRADTENPEQDPLSQYKALLTLRLRDEIMQFQMVNRDQHVDGLPLLLETIVNTLEVHGINLSDLPPPPPVVKRRY
ncbi:MAG TPA: hypothetical protein VGD78_18835 [Chthoniobacterales bacterium]